jgi:organic hydroperoxide reductase OsmC/OhrA
MKGRHDYSLIVKWTGNTGTGTSNYKGFERSHSIIVAEKDEIFGSSDPAFRGDKTKHNPEELLLASISSCHMLWYLHLCAVSGIIVTDYIDKAIGTMIESAMGGGKFTEATLNPIVTITDILMTEKANSLHEKANELCFVANSLNFPVYHKPLCVTASTGNLLNKGDQRWLIDDCNNARRQAKFGNAYHWWRLRSPGYYGKTSASISSNGSLYLRGNGVFGRPRDSGGVRPALWLELK